MAKNLFEKLNTLVQASLRGALRSDRPEPARPSADRLEQQLRSAQAHAAHAEQQQAALTDKILRLDAQIDAALAAQQDAQAQALLEERQIAIQQLRSLEQALADYGQIVTNLQAQTPAHTKSPTINDLNKAAPTPPLSNNAASEESANGVELDEIDLAARRSRLSKPD